MNKLGRILKTIPTLWRKWRLTRYMRRLRKTADALHRSTRETHFVVRVNGHITIISKSRFKYLRQRGVFPRQFTAGQLRQQAFYTSSLKAKQ